MKPCFCIVFFESVKSQISSYWLITDLLQAFPLTINRKLSFDNEIQFDCHFFVSAQTLISLYLQSNKDKRSNESKSFIVTAFGQTILSSLVSKPSSNSLRIRMYCIEMYMLQYTITIPKHMCQQK